MNKDKVRAITPKTIGWVEYKLSDKEMDYVWRCIDNKKENLAASGADKPIRRPIQMVIPDLEIPGIIATACARPIKIELIKV